MANKEFKKLQEHWYKILADNGFKDIEKVSMNSDPYRGASDVEREAKQDYFRIVEFHALSDDTDFRNDVDRFILRQYSYGASFRCIAKDLIRINKPLSTKWISTIVRHYEKRWGLR